MSTPADAHEQRKLRSIARRYERDGYRVTVPRQGMDLPAFLQGFTPDLIAESERDRVIVEVTRSDAVRGSNNLVDIAERVSREPGWRFELVTLPSFEQASALAAERLDLVEDRARQVMDTGHSDVAFVYALGALEALLKNLAARHGLRVANAPFMQVVRNLVSNGVISRDVFDEYEKAHRAWGIWLSSSPDKMPPPSVEDVEGLLALLRHLRNEMNATAIG